MLADALALGPRVPAVVPLPEEVRAFFRDRGVPADIVEDLADCCFEEWFPAGHLGLVPMTQVAEQNLALQKLGLRDGLVVIAAGANGDPVALDCRTRRIVFVESAALYYPHIATEPYHSTPYLYEEFWNAALTSQDFPWDSYDARRQWPEQAKQPDPPPKPRLRLFDADDDETDDS